MRVGNKQKVYGAILAAALVAWGADRVFSGPEPASAARPAARVVDAAVKSTSPAPAAHVQAGVAAVPAGWLAERMRPLPTVDAGSANLRDIFAAPQSWAPGTPVADQRKEDFPKKHHLTAVIIDPAGGRAVIDDQLVYVGQSIAGFQLAAVTTQAAYLTCDGEQVCLKLRKNSSGDVR